MRACSLLALVTVVGCAFNSESAPTLDNSCNDDAGCAEGVCEGGICIDDSGASVSVAIEVLRSATEDEGMTPASWAFDTETFSGPSVHDLELPPTRNVRGQVRWGGVPVPATLRFVRRMAGSVEPLAPVPVEVDTVRPPSGNGDSPQYDYSAILVAGETYDVQVLPSNDMVSASGQPSAPAIRSLPPLYLELEVAEGNAAEPVRFDVVFPVELVAPCEESDDVGCTLEAQVVSVDGSVELPELGLQVRAIDEQTERVVSSIGETDELGRFAIRISHLAKRYLIRVTSSSGGESFPAVSVDPEVAFEGEPIEKRIYIPRLPRVQFRGRVRDTNESAVPGATVRFLSMGVFAGDELGLVGSFAAAATTNEEGEFGAELLPGFYSVTVTPPEDENTWGVLSTKAGVVESLTTMDDLIVPLQIGLSGMVTTFEEAFAPGVTVLARARRGQESMEVHRSQEAVTTASGAFEMSVDAGQYDIHLKVPSESGFPWLVEPELVMDPSRGALMRHYELVPPVPIEGEIRNGTGSVVPQAVVRAYVLKSENGVSRPIQVAETTADEKGRYRLLIAPRLDAE